MEDNTSLNAIKKAQDAFSGAAKDMKIKSDEDVQAIVNETRHK